MIQQEVASTLGPGGQHANANWRGVGNWNTSALLWRSGGGDESVGEPFLVGRGGQLLNKIIGHAGSNEKTFTSEHAQMPATGKSPSAAEQTFQLPQLLNASWI
jgi:hypothetical protein